ncbi:unnamed protein product [Amoebophrya sp. A120]|nr:unnamed protein product [Amoebophrya sp. A120]|eukprot:GSA120T00020855001.1
MEGDASALKGSSPPRVPSKKTTKIMFSPQPVLVVPEGKPGALPIDYGNLKGGLAALLPQSRAAPAIAATASAQSTTTTSDKSRVPANGLGDVKIDRDVHSGSLSLPVVPFPKPQPIQKEQTAIGLTAATGLREHENDLGKLEISRLEILRTVLSEADIVHLRRARNSTGFLQDEPAGFLPLAVALATAKPNATIPNDYTIVFKMPDYTNETRPGTPAPPGRKGLAAHQEDQRERSARDTTKAKGKQQVNPDENESEPKTKRPCFEKAPATAKSSTSAHQPQSKMKVDEARPQTPAAAGAKAPASSARDPGPVDAEFSGPLHARKISLLKVLRNQCEEALRWYLAASYNSAANPEYLLRASKTTRDMCGLALFIGHEMKKSTSSSRMDKAKVHAIDAILCDVNNCADRCQIGGKKRIGGPDIQSGQTDSTLGCVVCGSDQRNRDKSIKAQLRPREGEFCVCRGQICGYVVANRTQQDHQPQRQGTMTPAYERKMGRRPNVWKTIGCDSKDEARSASGLVAVTAQTMAATLWSRYQLTDATQVFIKACITEQVASGSSSGTSSSSSSSSSSGTTNLESESRLLAALNTELSLLGHIVDNINSAIVPRVYSLRSSSRGETEPETLQANVYSLDKAIKLEYGHNQQAVADGESGTGIILEHWGPSLIDVIEKAARPDLSSLKTALQCMRPVYLKFIAEVGRAYKALWLGGVIHNKIALEHILIRLDDHKGAEGQKLLVPNVRLVSFAEAELVEDLGAELAAWCDGASVKTQDNKPEQSGTEGSRIKMEKRVRSLTSFYPRAPPMLAPSYAVWRSTSPTKGADVFGTSTTKASEPVPEADVFGHELMAVAALVTKFRVRVESRCDPDKGLLSPETVRRFVDCDNFQEFLELVRDSDVQNVLINSTRLAFGEVFAEYVKEKVLSESQLPNREEKQ